MSIFEGIILAELFRPERYFKPKSLEETQLLLKQFGGKARLLAGGTSLLVQKPSGVKCIIDMKRLPLDYIRGNPNGITIGATTTFSHILESPLMHTSPYNVLTDSARQLGHRNIRNLATIGGNICNAEPSADAPPALIALDAEAVIYIGEDSRRVPLEAFYTGVRSTILEQGEFLREIHLPRQSGLVGASFKKLSRTCVDVALFNVASKVTINEKDVCTEARIVIGAIVPKPIRSREAENSLLGKEITDESVSEAAQYACEEVTSVSENMVSRECSQEKVKELTEKAILEAHKRAREAY